MKVLVTGGAGYIGSILVPDLIDNGYQVTVVDNFFYNQNSLNHYCYREELSIIKGDICNYDLMKDVIKKNDVIIPLAGIVGAPACNKNISLSKIINVDAQLNIINLCSNNQLIVYPNTNSGYGIGSKNSFCDEQSPLNPISEYGRMKCQVESKLVEKENFVVFRLATVFGSSPRMRLDLLVNDFVYKAYIDNYLVLFEENFRRNYIHVRDVSNAFISSLKNEDMKGEIYNLGLSSANLTKKELALNIKKHIPKLEIQTAPLARDPDKRDYIVSNKKIENTGWEPMFNLDQGIIELIKLYKYMSQSNLTNK